MAHSPRYVADLQACLGVTGEAGECEGGGSIVRWQYVRERCEGAHAGWEHAKRWLCEHI
jgi:hypothetical protein